MGVTIDPKPLKCDCPDEFQDKTYGKGVRLHNPGGKAKQYGDKWRCTCCGKLK